MRNAIERFMDKVIPEPNSGCWLWDANTHHKTGYGMFSLKNKTYQAHRVSYKFFVADFDDNEKILHKCDNRCCVNPSHLFKGTQKDNVLDMYSKGREPKKLRENNGNSKLTEHDILVIRSSSKSGCELAREYGVTSTAIYHVKHNRSWR